MKKLKLVLSKRLWFIEISSMRKSVNSILDHSKNLRLLNFTALIFKKSWKNFIHIWLRTCMVTLPFWWIRWFFSEINSQCVTYVFQKVFMKSNIEENEQIFFEISCSLRRFLVFLCILLLFIVKENGLESKFTFTSLFCSRENFERL